MELPFTHQWPYAEALGRLMLALGIGTFVGMEREQRGHPAGLRTFGLAGLLGCLGGLEGPPHDVVCMAAVALLVIFLNAQSLRLDALKGHELTTSAALLVVGYCGLLCGQGHTWTPVAVGVITACLLAWKGSIHGFSAGLSEEELRSAILLAILAFVVYPALPAGGYGPHGALLPQEAWLTVILIAAIGFANYIALKLYGGKGIEIAGFLGGLVNSTVTVSELAVKVKESGGALASFARRGILFATVAMLVRNAVILGMLDAKALSLAKLPLIVMVACFVALSRFWPKDGNDDTAEYSAKHSSPFSLSSALRFGAIFLALQLISVVAKEELGNLGVYGTAFLGGLVSSASSVGAVAGLSARSQITSDVAADSAIIAVIASILVNMPLLRRSEHAKLTHRLTAAMLVVAVIGAAAAYAF